ncbi:MAG: hypothetical protein CL933_13285 [Deltaproteobacteria bacterium]|nr:hypothetical protein [Deltaproteobacteria bacterium]
MNDRPRLGEILVAAGIIDEMQLAAALGEQERWGRRLGVTLIKMGMLEEGHLIRALAKQLDLPIASLAGKKIADDVLALVPGRIASEHGVIPLFTKEGSPRGQLFLGMEDPSNLAVLDELGFLTSMEIVPVMIGPSELGEAIDRYYHGRANGGPPQSDPFLNTGAMNTGSLCLVVDDTAQPATEPTETETESEPTEPAPALREEPVELTELEPMLLEGLVDDVARAVEENESTRIVARAIAQLLVEKGLLSSEEIQRQIAHITAADTSESPGAD